MRQKIFLLAMIVAVPLLAARPRATIIWGNFGGVPMEYAPDAYDACPDDGYPEEGNPLTSCQEAWWNSV